MDVASNLISDDTQSSWGAMINQVRNSKSLISSFSFASASVYKRCWYFCAQSAINLLIVNFLNKLMNLKGHISLFQTGKGADMVLNKVDAYIEKLANATNTSVINNHFAKPNLCTSVKGLMQCLPVFM